MSTVSFEELFRDQYAPVLRDAVFVLGDRDLAKEVVNEAFTRLYVRWARVSRYDKPGAWVRRVAIRLAVRRQDRRGRETVEVEHGQDSGDHGLALDVRTAVRLLAPQQRAAVMLYYFDDLPVSEVARVLGCREGTAKAHLHQARARLGTLLTAYDAAAEGANCR